MSEQWAVEKAREWQQKSCSCGSFDSDQLVSKAECPECLAALLEEVAGEALATVQPALDAEKRERDEARAEGERLRRALQEIIDSIEVIQKTRAALRGGE